MTSASKNGRRGIVAMAGLSVAALALAGCSAGGDTGGDDTSGDSITVGTTDKVTTLDPAGSYDNGSLAVQTQVFPYLLNTDYQSTDVVPDLAESAEFTSPTEYTVTLPEGLKWANGNDLTSSDVKFSFDRNIAFAGPYVITSYDFNNLVSFKANPDYVGLLAAPKTETVNLKYYAESSNMKLDVQEGNIDVAYRSLSATDIADLKGNDKVNVVEGPGGEIRYIVFNFDTQPYGANAPEADPAKALAVRQA